MDATKFPREIHVIFFAYFLPHVTWHIIAMENHVSSICESVDPLSLSGYAQYLSEFIVQLSGSN